MKKILALLLACVMVLSVALTGCSSSSSDSDDADTEDTTEEEEDEESEGTEDTEDTEGADETAEEDADPDHIIVTYLHSGTEPADLDVIQDAVNEIIISEINVEIEFKTISISDSATNYSLWISSGETVDLMCLAFQDIKTYTNSGQLQSLDELITEETAPTLYALAQEYPILTTVAGTSYGLSTVNALYGTRPGIIIREEYAEETGLVNEDEDYVYSLDELTEIFAAIKENHEDCYPFGILGSSVSSGSSITTILLQLDALGSNVLAGVLMGTDSSEVVNLFETDEYKDYLQTVAEWYDAGYIMPDAATTDSSASELMTNGKIASYVMNVTPEQMVSTYGFDLIGLATGVTSIGATSNLINWTVPITSENPEAAITFMDYLYSDSDLMNIIQWGIEGEHYEFVDEENGVIDFANDYDGSTSPYYNTLGLWGNQTTAYTYDADNTQEAKDEFTASSLENKYVSYGFVFDSSDYSTQLTACQTVLDQYQAALETGSLGVDGWEDVYETMVSALKTAGIEDIIAECQAQLDAFLAEQ